MLLKSISYCIMCVLAFNFSFISFNAFANHVSTTTCSNSCVTTVNSDTMTITTTDCCGGTVTTVIQVHNSEPGRPN